MNQNKKKTKEAVKEKRDVPLTLMFTKFEAAEIDKKAEKAKVTRSQFMRIGVLKLLGPVQLDLWK